jgi:hypothetical protein
MTKKGFDSMKIIQNFFGQLLSVDESRKSVVVLILILVTIFALYRAKITGDIPPNCQVIILTLSGVIFGINSLQSIAGIITSKNQSQGYSSYTYNPYNSSIPQNSDPMNLPNNQNISPPINNADINGGV